MRQHKNWYTEDKDTYSEYGLGYIVRNRIETGNRLIDELEFDENMFFKW
jgi:hypothetical protein